MRSALLAACLGAVIAAGPAAADTGETTPKRGGTLTYMIPADAPPSLDGHRESTYRHGARDRAVLQRADPDQSGEPVGSTTAFRLRSVHRDAEADG